MIHITVLLSLAKFNKIISFTVEANYLNLYGVFFVCLFLVSGKAILRALHIFSLNMRRICYLIIPGTCLDLTTVIVYNSVCRVYTTFGDQLLCFLVDLSCVLFVKISIYFFLFSILFFS